MKQMKQSKAVVFSYAIILFLLCTFISVVLSYCFFKEVNIRYTSLFLHTSIFATSHKGFHAYGYPIDVLKIHSGKKVLFLDKIVFERTWDPT